MAVFPIMYSPPSRCISRLRIGGTYTNTIYYTTSLSMSINVNKRMCRAFAKVMYFTVVIACKLHSLRLLASLREKKGMLSPSHSIGQMLRNRVLLHYQMLDATLLESSFTHASLCASRLRYSSFASMHAHRRYTLPTPVLDIRSQKHVFQSSSAR